MDVGFNNRAGSAFGPLQRASFDWSRNPNENRNEPPNAPGFEIFDWYPKYQSCQRYFLDHAQHSDQVQTLAAFVNIILPCHRHTRPVTASNSPLPHSAGLPVGMGMPPQMGSGGSLFFDTDNNDSAQEISLIPYIRRLIATGFDNPGILHGFFGNDWKAGVGPLHEVERRNYLFAAKSGSWLEVKAEYNMSPDETIPFLKPLQRATEEEISAADKQWSDWLAMQDWMVGPRAPDAMDQSPQVQSSQIKREPTD